MRNSKRTATNSKPTTSSPNQSRPSPSKPTSRTDVSKILYYSIGVELYVKYHIDWSQNDYFVLYISIISNVCLITKIIKIN